MAAIALMTISFYLGTAFKRSKGWAAAYRAMQARAAVEERNARASVSSLQENAANLRRAAEDPARQRKAAEVASLGERLHPSNDPKAWHSYAEDASRKAERARERVGYYARLRRKYARAADFPWLPLAPDPPPP